MNKQRIKIEEDANMAQKKAAPVALNIPADQEAKKKALETSQ